MSDRREEVLNAEHWRFVVDKGISSIHSKTFPEAYKQQALNAMDEYMKESCMALLQYMADNSITLSLASLPQDPLFSWKGNLLTKDELFENFL